VILSRFGFDRQPFRPAVDPAAYFPASTHERAIRTLATAFDNRDPIVLIDGMPGVGKSLVARQWLDHLSPDVSRVLLPNTKAQTPSDIFQAILFDLHLPYQCLSEQELRLAMTGQLLDAAKGSYPTVLIIDEAHHLSSAVFEELRLLGNLETRRGPVLFLVLVAHSMVRNALRHPANEHFVQRIASTITIEPLTIEESTNYLRHQVQAAGAKEREIFDPEAITLLAETCGGIPRILNRAAHLAIQLTAEADASLVEVEAVLEALDRLEMRPDSSPAAEQAAGPVLLPHPSRDGPISSSRPGTEAKIRGKHEVGPAGKSKDKPARKRTA
jgi:type II secretory pathway predicted ATPase ExeA